MRPIPTSVQTLLKSKSMIGENKPTHELYIEEMPTGYTADIPEINWVRPRSDSDSSFSFAQRKDGKICVLWGGGTEMKEGYAEDLISFLANNSVTLVGSIFGGSAGIRGTVFNDNDGELYLCLRRRDSAATDTNQQQVRIYKSTSGNGGDWTLHGIVRDTVQTETNEIVGGVPTGGALILNYTAPGATHKRWVITAPYFTGGDGGNFRDNAGVYTSDDGGVSWTNRRNVRATTWGTVNHSRNIGVAPDGSLWWHIFSDRGSGYSVMWCSTNNGESWWPMYNLRDHPEFGLGDVTSSNFFHDETYLYILTIDWGRGLWRTETPGDVNSWVKIYDFASLTPKDSYWNYFSSQRMAVISYCHRIQGVEVEAHEIAAKRINISRNKGMASSLSVAIDNKKGIYTPTKAGNWEKVIWTGNEIQVDQGYGDERERTFTGLIDSVDCKSFPHEIEISARDKTKLLLDKTITAAGGEHVLSYTDTPIEDIVTNLVALAGGTAGNIEQTGVSITHKFSWEKYGDAIQFLANLVDFVWYADEDGNINFEYNEARQPEETDTIVMDDTGEVQTLYLDTPTGGTYDLGIVGDMKTLNWNDGAATIQAQLELIYGAGNVAVSADTDFTITFDSSVGDSALVADFTSLTSGGSPSLTVDTAYSLPWHNITVPNSQEVIVPGSEDVRNVTQSTDLIKDTDYEIEYSPQPRIKRIAAAGLDDGDTIEVSFVYPAWTFREGEDITQLSVLVDDRYLYREVIVHGADGPGEDATVIEAKLDNPDADEYNLPYDKILHMMPGDAADTQAKCDEIAAKALIATRQKARITSLRSIGIPWLQIGDCVRAVETSSDTDRFFVLMDLSSTQTEKDYTMYFNAYQPIY